MGGGGGMGNGMVQFWLLGLSASVIDFFIKIKNTTFIDPSYDINKLIMVALKTRGPAIFKTPLELKKLFQELYY